MRKIIVFLVFLCSLAIFFAGCEKETNPEGLTNDTEQTTLKGGNVSTPDDPKPWGRNNRWNPNKGCCDPDPYDCYDETVVIGTKPEALAMRGFVSEVKNKGNVATFVEQNYTKLNSYIKAAHLEKVVSNELVISTRENKSINTTFVIFSDKTSGDVSVVYPFVVM